MHNPRVEEWRRSEQRSRGGWRGGVKEVGAEEVGVE
jgi:hypothetical protein